MHIRLAYDDYHGFTVLVVKGGRVVRAIETPPLALVNELLDEYEPVHLDELMDDGTGDDSPPSAYGATFVYRYKHKVRIISECLLDTLLKEASTMHPLERELAVIQNKMRIEGLLQG